MNKPNSQEWREDFYQYFHNAWKVEGGNKKKVAWQTTHFIESLISQVIEDSFMEFLSAKQNNQDFTKTLAYLRIKYLGGHNDK